MAANAREPRRVVLQVEPPEEATPPSPARASGRRGGALRPQGPPNAVGHALTTKMEQPMLRGVRVDKALVGCGMHWVQNDGSENADPDAEYAMSEQARFLDYFLSHDWATGRWPKWVSLCIIFNLQMATILCLLVIAVPLIAGFDSILEISRPEQFTIAGETIEVRNTVLQTVSMSVFWIVFFFWRNIVGVFCRGRLPLVFIDKFCIHQTDQKLKQKGILSIAGFLKSSNNLVVLWSPRYFSRLWCSYEIACWLHLDRDIDSTVWFLPVDLGIVFFVAIVGLTIGMIAIQFAHVLHPDMDTWGVNAVRMLVLATAVHLARAHVTALKGLPQQLENFAVRKSECFCCSNNHIHPVTKKPLSCDRSLVYSTLTKWFGDEMGSMASGYSNNNDFALDEFDQLVRTRVQEAVSRKSDRLVPYRVPYRAVLAMTISGAVYWLDVGFGFSRKRSAALWYRMWICAFSMYFFVFPCLVVMVLSMIYLAVGRGWGSVTRWRSPLVSVGIITAAVGAYEVMWQAVFISASYEDPKWQMVVVGALLLLTAWCYKGRIAYRCFGRILPRESMAMQALPTF